MSIYGKMKETLTIMYITEAHLVNTTPGEIKDEIFHFFVHRDSKPVENSTPNHFVKTTPNGSLLHHTGDYKNFSDVSLYAPNHDGSYTQVYINKGAHGEPGGITRNLNYMLDKGHKIVSSTMHSSNAISYYSKLFERNKDKINFMVIDGNKESPMSDINDAYASDTHKIGMSRK
jgi:hypothetical protein